MNQLEAALSRAHEREEKGEQRLAQLTSQLSDADGIIAGAKTEENAAVRQAHLARINKGAATMLRAALRSAKARLAHDTAIVNKDRAMARDAVALARGEATSESRAAQGAEAQTQQALGAQKSANSLEQRAAMLEQRAMSEAGLVTKLNKKSKALKLKSTNEKNRANAMRIEARKLVVYGRKIASEALTAVRTSLQGGGGSAAKALVAQSAENKLAATAKKDTATMRQDHLDARVLRQAARRDRRQSALLSARSAAITKTLPGLRAEAHQALVAARRSAEKQRKLRLAAVPGNKRVAALESAEQRLSGKERTSVTELASAEVSEHKDAAVVSSDNAAVRAEEVHGLRLSRMAAARLRKARGRLMAALRVRDQAQSKLKLLKDGLESSHNELNMLRQEVKRVKEAELTTVGSRRRGARTSHKGRLGSEEDNDNL